MARKREIRERIVRIVTFVILIPIVVVIIRNVGYSVKLSRQISATDSEAVEYQQRITEDSLLLESIKYNEGLEHYARENFFMHRRGERIFVVE